MSTVHHAGQSAGIQHIELNGVSLGLRPPVLQLDHGIQIPIDPRIMRPVAKFRRWAVIPDDAHQAKLLDADNGYSTQHVVILRVNYPGDYYAASIETEVVSVEDGGSSTTWWHTDEIWPLDEIVEELIGVDGAEYYDDEFRHEAEELIRREDLEFWHSRNAKPNARLRVFNNNSELGVQFGNSAPVYFLSTHQKAHRLLALMADIFPHSKLPAHKAAQLLKSKTEKPQRWAQNLCVLINDRIAKLNTGYELACSNADKLVVWEKVAA